MHNDEAGSIDADRLRDATTLAVNLHNNGASLETIEARLASRGIDQARIKAVLEQLPVRPVKSVDPSPAATPRPVPVRRFGIWAGIALCILGVLGIVGGIASHREADFFSAEAAGGRMPQLAFMLATRHESNSRHWRAVGIDGLILGTIMCIIMPIASLTGRVAIRRGSPFGWWLAVTGHLGIVLGLFLFPCIVLDGAFVSYAEHSNMGMLTCWVAAGLFLLLLMRPRMPSWGMGWLTLIMVASYAYCIYEAFSIDDLLHRAQLEHAHRFLTPINIFGSGFIFNQIAIRVMKNRDNS